MAQMESDSERTEKSSSSTPIAAELAAIGKKRVEECINAQTELLGRLQERNRQWLDRLQQEANSCFRICLQVDGSAFDRGRDDRVSGMDQLVV